MMNLKGQVEGHVWCYEMQYFPFCIKCITHILYFVIERLFTVYKYGYLSLYDACSVLFMREGIKPVRLCYKMFLWIFSFFLWHTLSYSLDLILKGLATIFTQELLLTWDELNSAFIFHVSCCINFYHSFLVFTLLSPPTAPKWKTKVPL